MTDQRLSAVLFEIYAAGLDLRRWPQALQGVADLFGAKGSMIFWGPLSTGVRSFCSPALAEIMPIYLTDKWRIDLRNQRALERNLLEKLTPVVDADMVTLQEMEEHPYFKDFCTPAGFHWNIAMPMMIRPDFPVMINALRPKEAGPFGEAEKALMIEVARHVAQSVALSLRIMEAEAANVLGRQAFDRLACGVFVIDADRRVSFHNAAAAALAPLGVEARGGMLTLADREGQARLREALVHVLDCEPEQAVGSSFPVTCAGHPAGLTVHVIPALASPDVADPELRALFTARHALVYIIDPLTDRPVDPLLVEKTLGLTRAEARVAALVGRGIAPDAAAVQLGLSVETVRTVLKKVYGKLGIGRQGELVRIVTRLDQVRA